MDLISRFFQKTGKTAKISRREILSTYGNQQKYPYTLTKCPVENHAGEKNWDNQPSPVIGPRWILAPGTTRCYHKNIFQFAFFPPVKCSNEVIYWEISSI